MEKKYTKEFKNFSILALVYMGLSALYTLFSISFHFDISILAFVISLLYIAVTFYILGIQMLKNTNGTHWIAATRLIEFLPYVFFITFIVRRAGEFGTPFWYDLITVILWLSIFVLSFIVSKKIAPKRNEKIVKGWAFPPTEKKYKGIYKFWFEVGDWIYTIVWSIFTILIFQIFVLQLYEIPSESMVSTFLIKDRVFVSKIDCGPKFPLTDVGLPTFRKYKKGDTVVLRNPHYSLDRKTEVKNVTSQLIYMLSIMTINLNKDENGQLKADPLVKRIVGEPGEQLVMQDGVLYYRTKNNDQFVPSEVDSKYAVWNLNQLRSKFGKSIKDYRLSNQEHKLLLQIEEERRNFNLDLAAYRIQEIVNELDKVCTRPVEGTFNQPPMEIYYFVNNVDSLASDVFNLVDAKEWFEKFLTSWISEKDNVRDIYEESNFRLNVMSKLAMGELVLRYCQAYNLNEDLTSIFSDLAVVQNQQNLTLLGWYIQDLLDSRNMPVFPANDKEGNPQYIPDDNYLMMGDNRFNSLDMRHSNEPFLRNVTTDDKMSISYMSFMEPRYVNKKLIIGKPIFTFWPINRIGKV